MEAMFNFPKGILTRQSYGEEDKQMDRQTDTHNLETWDPLLKGMAAPKGKESSGFVA